jgi:hypothetical protein
LSRAWGEKGEKEKRRGGGEWESGRNGEWEKKISNKDLLLRQLADS